MSVYEGLRLAATYCLDYDHQSSPAYEAILRQMACIHCRICRSGFVEDDKGRSTPCTHPGVDPWSRPALAGDVRSNPCEHPACLLCSDPCGGYRAAALAGEGA